MTQIFEFVETASCASSASTRTSSSRPTARRGSRMSTFAACVAVAVRRTARARAPGDFIAPDAKARSVPGPVRTSQLSIDFPHRQNRLLRVLPLPHPLHPAFSFLLLLEELALARDVAAVALGEHVLAQRLDRLARDHAVADRGLQRHLEHLPRDELL